MSAGLERRWVLDFELVTRDCLRLILADPSHQIVAIEEVDPSAPNAAVNLLRCADCVPVGAKLTPICDFPFDYWHERPLTKLLADVVSAAILDAPNRWSA